MSDTIMVNEAQSLSLSFQWRDADGLPIDLALGTATIFDANNPAMTEMILTIGAGGIIAGLMSSVSIAKLANGRVTNFRMRVSFPTLEVLTTPPIWVQVI